MKASVGSGDDFELPKAGLTIGRCFKIIDLGTQESKYQGNVSYKRQILVDFELPMMMVEFEKDGESKKMPMTISKKYTLSFNKKAHLRKDMEQWYGVQFNDADIENSGGFDPTKIIGRPAQVMIVHSDDGKYANIAGLMPLAEGMSCPEQVHDSLVFDLDEFDPVVWGSFSEKMQSWILKSPEAQKATGSGTGQQPEPDPVFADGFDDVPF